MRLWSCSYGTTEVRQTIRCQIDENSDSPVTLGNRTVRPGLFLTTAARWTPGGTRRWSCSYGTTEVRQFIRCQIDENSDSLVTLGNRTVRPGCSDGCCPTPWRSQMFRNDTCCLASVSSVRRAGRSGYFVAQWAKISLSRPMSLEVRPISCNR